MRRLLAALLLAAFALLAMATPAAAHAHLIASTPADGATLPVAPPEVRLTFSESLRAGFSTVTVTGPNGAVWTVGDPTVTNTVLTVPVRPAGPAGPYTVGYRVLSGDGHPVSGTVRFTLTTPVNAAANPPSATAPDGASQPGVAGSPAPRAATTTNDEDSGVPVWIWLAGAVVLLGIGLVIALRMGRAADSGEGS